jgi:rod shape-determining protein MreD
MKGLVYLAILLLIIPVQAALFDPLPLGGIKPDLALALIYVIGLLTGPVEASLAGMAMGLVQDIGSASPLGMNGLTRGLIGLGAGLLSRRVLDIASPMNVIFLMAFSLAEGFIIMLFMQTFFGDVPFFSLLLTVLLPQALVSGLLGIFLLRFMNRKSVMSMLMRRSLLKE